MRNVIHCHQGGSQEFDNLKSAIGAKFKVEILGTLNYFLASTALPVSQRWHPVGAILERFRMHCAAALHGASRGSTGRKAEPQVPHPLRLSALRQVPKHCLKAVHFRRGPVPAISIWDLLRNLRGTTTFSQGRVRLRAASRQQFDLSDLGDKAARVRLCSQSAWGSFLVKGESCSFFLHLRLWAPCGWT